MRDKGTNSNYEVGYRRPPRSTQFKKGGPSPNPSGRPRGRRIPNPANVLLGSMNVRINGKILKLSVLEAYIHLIKDMAFKGDLKAGQMLIFLCKLLGVLERPEEIEDFVFTLNLDDRSPPDWIKTNAEINRERPAKNAGDIVEAD